MAQPGPNLWFEHFAACDALIEAFDVLLDQACAARPSCNVSREEIGDRIATFSIAGLREQLCNGAWPSSRNIGGWQPLVELGFMGAIVRLG